GDGDGPVSASSATWIGALATLTVRDCTEPSRHCLGFISVTLDTLPVRVRDRMAADIRRGRLALVLLIAALWPVSTAQAFRDGFGLHVTSARKLDSRLVALTVSTRALTGPANVRILLPAGYNSHPARRYPVLYLLHGTSGGAADWTTTGDAERTTAGRPLIVVMPDIALNDDGGGWGTDWGGTTPAGRPEGEAVHHSPPYSG